MALEVLIDEVPCLIDLLDSRLSKFKILLAIEAVWTVRLDAETVRGPQVAQGCVLRQAKWLVRFFQFSHKPSSETQWAQARTVRHIDVAISREPSLIADSTSLFAERGSSAAAPWVARPPADAERPWRQPR